MNTTRMGQRRTAAALLAAALTVLGGCASLGPQTPEQQVQQRANAYWQARLKADSASAYALLVPAYRELRSEKDFAKSQGAGINGEKVEVTQVTCEAQKCNARIALTVKPAVPGLKLPVVTSYMDDTWVLEQGQWWRFETP